MKTLQFFLILFSTSSSFAAGFDAKALYQALKTEAVAGVEADSHYHYWLKSVPGFITCKKWDFAWDAYNCYFGGVEGYSMADGAYHYLDVPEELISDPDAAGSKTYRKSVGGLTCTRTVFDKPKVRGDMMFGEKSECGIKLKFGMKIR